MLRKRGKRGQFYLIAAIVIIAVIISFAVISNSPKKKIPIKLYDLKQELGLESENVLAYGTYNELDATQMKTLLQKFVTDYVGYAGAGKNLYFIFGNSDKITIMSYQQLATEDASIKIGGTETPLVICKSSSPCTGQEFTPEQSGHVQIKIGEGQDSIHNFKLNTGENFYFVISQTIGGETYVVTS